jgi:tetratricopeptide (TPR) repeat protein
MKLYFKYGFIIFFFILCIKIVQSNTEGNIKGIDDSSYYQQKQKYYQKKIQQYWNISPDTSVYLADSALALAKANKNISDISYFNLLKGVAYYFQGKNDEGVKTIKRSLRFGNKALNDKLLASANNMLSLVYRNLGIYDSAIYYSKMALKLRLENTKDSNDIAGSYDNLNTIFYKMGEYDSAIHYALKAAEIFENRGNNTELAYVWSNLSNLYATIGDKEKMYHYLVLSYEILKKEGSEAELAEIFENLGGYFLEYGSPDSAMYYFKKASVIYRKLQRYDGYADSKKAMGEIYLRLGKNRAAERELLAAYKQFKSSKRLMELAETEILLAEIELRKSNYRKGLQFLDNASKRDKRLNSDLLRLKILKEKEKLLEKGGEPTEALSVFHQIIALKDSINKKELESKIEELSTKYQTERINSENRKLKQQQEIEKMKAKEMQILFLVSILIAALFVVILLLILQKRKRNILLQEQKLDIIKKEEALIKSKLQNTELKKQELLKENDYRSRQLTTYTLHMMQKNLILKEVIDEVKVMEGKDPGQIKKELVNLKIQLINAVSSDSDWDNFSLFFEKVNPNFFIRLKEKYPNISNKDEKLCALIRLNMDINEAASVLNVDANSIRIARYRLRKKMGLDPDDDLYKIIHAV